MHENGSFVLKENSTDMYSNQTIDEAQRCLFLTFNSTKIDKVKNVYIVAATMDTILILPTIILNVLLIISLYRSSEIRKPSTKLLFSLAMTDLLVGLVTEPAFLAKKIGELTHNFSLYCKMGMITYNAGSALSSVSFINVTAIAIDRYLVVHRGTKYKSTVTNKRVVVLVVAIWVSVVSFICVQLYTRRFVHFLIIAIIIITCVVITSACYIRSFITLKKQKKAAKQLFETRRELTTTSTNCPYKKSIYSMFYIYIAFLLCYLPYCMTSICAILVGESAAIWGAESFSSVAVYSNSLVSPILLLWRMRNVREAFKRTCRASTQNLHRLIHSTTISDKATWYI